MIKKILSYFTKNKLEALEIEAQDIDSHVVHVILDAEQTVKDLKNALKKDDIEEKNADTKELMQDFEQVGENIAVLKKEIDKIRQMKIAKDLMYGPDNNFLNDKIDQLDAMGEAIGSLLEITEEAPSDEEYTNSVLDEIVKYLNELITALNKIKADDDALLALYKKLQG
ncbi:MAG: hypothetical protein ABIJ21_05490 [Nanoarchaeota archaeon]